MAARIHDFRKKNVQDYLVGWGGQRADSKMMLLLMEKIWQTTEKEKKKVVNSLVGGFNPFEK